MKRTKLFKELLPLIGQEIWLEIHFDQNYPPIDVRIWVRDALQLVQYFPVSFTYSYSVINQDPVLL